jgi:hypothetical protein
MLLARSDHAVAARAQIEITPKRKRVIFARRERVFLLMVTKKYY